MRTCWGSALGSARFEHFRMNHRTGEIVLDQYFMREPRKLAEVGKAYAVLVGWVAVVGSDAQGA